MEIVLFDDSVEAFVLKLDLQSAARVYRTIDLLERFGNNLGMPHSKSLGKGLFELRIRGKREVRILYTFHRKKAVLLHCFIKKSNRISRKDLEDARRKKERLT